MWSPKGRFKQAVAVRDWPGAVRWGLLFLLIYAMGSLIIARTEDWANDQIDIKGSEAVNAITGFLASGWLLGIGSGVLGLAWALAMWIVLRRTPPDRETVSEARPVSHEDDSGTPDGVAELQPTPGSLAELIAGDEVERSYQFTKDERDLVRELVQWYEAQKANLQQYIRLTIEDVDCDHALDGTPYIEVSFRAHNYHTVSLKITKLEPQQSEVASDYLPPLTLNRTVHVNRGDDTPFGLRLYINGTNIPDVIRDLATKGEKVAWKFAGTWKAEIYGAEHTIETEPLRWVGIPKVREG